MKFMYCCDAAKALKTTERQILKYLKDGDLEGCKDSRDHNRWIISGQSVTYLRNSIADLKDNSINPIIYFENNTTQNSNQNSICKSLLEEFYNVYKSKPEKIIYDHITIIP